MRPVAAALVAVLIAIAAALSVPVRADEIFASVGTGEPNGIYYPVGKAICQIVNRDLSMHSVRCSPEATPGSAYNIGALQSGELEFAIVSPTFTSLPTKAKARGSDGRSLVCAR